MIKQTILTLKNKDEITLRLYKRLGLKPKSKYLEMYTWDDYEGRGGSAILGNVEELDRLIDTLVEMRKEML